MSDELDLDRGEPDRGDSAAERRRKRREGTTGGVRAEQKIENEVRTQLARAFEGISKNRYTRGDVELGGVITEESDVMTEAFVTITTNVPFLRMPVIIILNLIITLMAFGRVGRILLDRWQDRRARRQAEAQEQQVQYGPEIMEQ